MKRFKTGHLSRHFGFAPFFLFECVSYVTKEQQQPLARRNTQAARLTLPTATTCRKNLQTVFPVVQIFINTRGQLLLTSLSRRVLRTCPKSRRRLRMPKCLSMRNQFGEGELNGSRTFTFSPHPRSALKPLFPLAWVLAPPSP